MNPFTIPTRFTAVDQLTRPVRGMASSVHDSFHRLNTGISRSNRLFRQLVPGISDATKQIMSYASVGAMLAFGGSSIKSVMDYETAVQSLSAVTGTYGDDLTRLKAIVNDTAADTKRSATDIAGAFEVVGSMMSQYLDDPKGLRQITEAGITLSNASRQELVPTLKQLTSIMNQFDLKAGQAGDTINRLTAGEVVGSLSTSNVAEALQEFGAGAFAANIDLSESVALVEALAKQMKTDKIGVGARNILTIMDSATGLSKKARKELRHAGVDMKVLMDSSKTLGERLRELSKLQGNEKAITRVFGRENKTAAQVIFNQLDTYDQFLAQIRQTNAAEKQAATNSDTLRVAVEELSNTWVNYLTSNDAANEGLAKAKDVIRFVTNNIDGMVSVGMTAIKMFALWKGAILTQQLVLGGYNATMVISRGISQAYFLTDMVKYVAVTQGVTKSTAALSIAQQSLNAAWKANPIGIIVTGLTMLAGATWWAIKRTRELKEEYREKVGLDIPAEVDRERRSVEKLVEEYVMLGKSIREANALAMNERMLAIETERKKNDQRVAELQAQLEQSKLHVGAGHKGAGFALLWNKMVADGKTARELAREQEKGKNLAVDQSFEVQRAQAAVRQGVVDYNDVAGIFSLAAQRKPASRGGGAGESSDSGIDYLNGNMPQRDRTQYGPLVLDYQKLRDALRGSQRVVVEFKGAPPGTGASGDGVVQTGSSY